MSSGSFVRAGIWIALGVLVLVPPAGTQQPAKVQPKLEPIAETRLLMEGLAHANFRGLERLLAQKPADAQTWTFARGQALLIAETANLLMLRPPKSQGQAVWFDRAAELRSSAKELATTLASQEFEKSKTGLISMAGKCNRCHQSFRIPVDIAAFADKAGQ
jgi:hypothetical protein